MPDSGAADDGGSQDFRRKSAAPKGPAVTFTIFVSKSPAANL